MTSHKKKKKEKKRKEKSLAEFWLLVKCEYMELGKCAIGVSWNFQLAISEKLDFQQCLL